MKNALGEYHRMFQSCYIKKVYKVITLLNAICAKIRCAWKSCLGAKTIPPTQSNSKIFAHTHTNTHTDFTSTQSFSLVMTSYLLSLWWLGLSHSTCGNRHGMKSLGQLLSNYLFHTDARCTQVCTDSWRNPTLRGSAPGSRRKESPCSHSYCLSSDTPEHCQRSQPVNRGHKTERESKSGLQTNRSHENTESSRTKENKLVLIRQKIMVRIGQTGRP